MNSKAFTLGFSFCVFVLSLFVGRSLAQVREISRDEFRKIRQQQMQTKQTQLERLRLLKSAATASAQDDYDVGYYKLDLRIDPAAKQVSGTVEVRARARTNDFATVELDFDSNMTVDDVTGAVAAFTHLGNVLQIELSQALQNGEEFSFQVAYHGQPESGGFGAFGFNTHAGSPIVWSLSEPYFARSWWPCKDTPDDKADSVDVVATVPKGLIVASNGVLRNRTDNGDGTLTFHWHEGHPITTYLVSLAITNYATYSEWFHYATTDSMEVQYYIYPEKLADAQSQLTQTLTMLTYFSKIFGPYPFLDEKYGIAQFPWGGGMEHQTITSQGGFGTTLTVHELAHQWWGDKITNATWTDIWLNEGFASYSEALYYEHTRGEDYYHTYMGYMDWGFPFAIFVDDTSSVSRIFHGTVYDKGAWLLHMLRHVVGDSTFFDILLAYSSDPRFAYGNATTAGFQSVCEAVSGRDLDWFFQPWIYEVGRPVYRVDWNADNADGSYVLNLSIQQTQVPQQALFPMPIDLHISTVSGDTLITVFNDAAVQNFSLKLANQPTGLQIDPGDWILKKIDSVTSVLESRQIPSEFSLQQNYPNPFNSTTKIDFRVSAGSEVEIAVYNLQGQLVRVLTHKNYEPGEYQVSWDGSDAKGMLAATGVYVYQMRAGDFVQQRKLILLK